MEQLSNINSNNVFGYQEWSKLSQQEQNSLPSDIKIEAAANSLFDLVRYKVAYDCNNSVKELEKEFVYIFNQLTANEQQLALEQAYNKLSVMHVIE